MNIRDIKRKKITEMTIGVPRPPLRIMAPSGAPIRKKIMIEIGSEILRCHSILLR